MIPDKLPKIPQELFRTNVSIVLYSAELDENGAPIIVHNAEHRCIWSDKRRRTVDAEKRIIDLEGSIIVDGDVAPEANNAADGYAVVYGEKLKIYKIKRARNPDGSVHHTTMELI